MTERATALVTHPDCLEHAPPEGHPESPARLRAVLDALAAYEFAGLRREQAPLASRAALERIHTPAYIAGVFADMPVEGFAMLDSDTAVSPGSRDASLRAAGAVVRAVDMVMAGEVRNAFCAVRPPGHHAERNHAMGFCVFNNVAIGAAHARAVHDLRRVAVVDFDVHHGNGTENSFRKEPELFYASIHQSPLYPGTGNADFSDHIVNVLLAPGSDGAAFRRAFSQHVLPRLTAFAPEFVLISAGFDAHRDDPLAQLRLDERDFAWATGEVCAVAADLCGGRVVSTLEGGYDLPALAHSASAHVRALMAA